MKPFTLVASIIFGIVSLAHLVRMISRVEVVVGGWVAPQWVSIPGFLIAGALAVALWREGRTR